MKKFIIIIGSFILITLAVLGKVLYDKKIIINNNLNTENISNKITEYENGQYQFSYKPISANLKTQYKQEIEQIINKEYPIAIKKTEQTRSKAHEMYLKVLKDKKLYMDYAVSNFDIIISTGEFDLLSKIIDATNKYVKIEDEEALATDYNGAILDFLNPYFIDNNINTEKLDNLGAFVNKKHKEILQEQEHLHKIIYPDENY